MCMCVECGREVLETEYPLVALELYRDYRSITWKLCIYMNVFVENLCVGLSFMRFVVCLLRAHMRRGGMCILLGFACLTE